ncbi:MAG: TonB-dependent receptor plug domain-containing protein [Imperialibacter sp.]|uniref:TonB-dependent receptor plug domain-containing protein n=1 Tax=Imperialibacter sp. TaxID=2038411 RepID=UPI003A898818
MYAVGIRVVGLVACVILFLFGAKGQEVAADSIRMGKILAPVEVSDTWLHSYAVGGHSELLDSMAIQTQAATSLGKLLQAQQGIYLKEYGPGMLNSISLRGTSASQTSLLWNGLPINFPSLGQADFSLIPNFFIDQAEVFYGGVSSLAGSGAIGGAVAVSDKVDKNLRSIGLTQEVGSFGSSFSGLKVKASGERAGISLAGFYKESDNDYTYRNLAKAGQPIEKQSHGAYNGKGLKAAAFWSPWSKGVFDIEGWLTHYNRDIIPPYTVASAGDTQVDRSLRLSLGYVHRIQPLLKWESRIGRIYDFIKFNGLASATTQYMWNNSIEWMPIAKVQLRAGGLINHIVADVPEYGGGLTENRSSAFLMVNWFPSVRWTLNAKVRQGIVAGTWNPVAPSLGADVLILKSDEVSLNWRSQISRSYRVPTLNDRYWSPGGNLNLKPEQGWNAESGLDYSIKLGKHALKASATGFAHWIQDWILWLPQAEGYWSPVNVRNVFSRGGELSAGHEWSVGKRLLTNDINYKLTVSQIRAGYLGDDSNIGNQLPYVPLHQGNWSFGLKASLWHFHFQVSFYGSRYTLVDNDINLDAYTLWNLEAGRQIRAGKSLFSLSVKVDNVLGKRYENLQYRPMPGRSFSFQLNYTLKQDKK